MPELPEVEVVRRGLARWVAGRTIALVDVGHPRGVRRHAGGAADFQARLAGRTPVAACRRGKYLWLPLDSGAALVGHLGMSGQLLVVPPDAPQQPHQRARFRFVDGGPELRFVDQRTFGGLFVDDLAEGVASTVTPASLRHIAPDPLEPVFAADVFAAAVRRRRTGIKRALLDQTLISGIGNIYADEALWRACLHWARRTQTLTRPRLAQLLDAVRGVFADAVEAGGTSFDRLYVNVNGAGGLFDRALDVYGRAGQPCHRCGTPIRRDPFMNRSSFTCPRCQPRPRVGRF